MDALIALAYRVDASLEGTRTTVASPTSNQPGGAVRVAVEALGEGGMEPATGPELLADGKRRAPPNAIAPMLSRTMRTSAANVPRRVAALFRRG